MLPSRPGDADRMSYPVTNPPAGQRNGLAVGRLAWFLMTLLVIFLILAGIPLRYNQLVAAVDTRSLLDLGLTANVYAWYLIGLNLLVVLAHIVIAMVIMWRRSNDYMALLVAFALVTNGAIFPLSGLYQSGSGYPLWQFLANLVIFLGLTFSISLLYMFPTGHFAPAWTRLPAIAWAVLALLAVFLPASTFNLANWPRLGQASVWFVVSGIGLFAQIFRYQNVSTLVQRQQTKWALLGLIAAGTGPLLLIIDLSSSGSSTAAVPNILYQRVGASFFTFSLLFNLVSTTCLRLVTILFPLSFAIAILRYRLWDIDFIINRALVYGSLTWTLLLIYFISILIFQEIFRAFTGQVSPLAVVFSTMTIAVLFNPLRQRLQDEIDRRFYRRKYDAEQTLAHFAVMARDEVELEALTTELIHVVNETMQPEHVRLWLRKH